MRFFEILHRIRPNIIPFIAVFISIIALVAFWVIVPGGSFNQNENGDYSNYYLPVARNIAEGKGISLNGETAIKYPAGYPVLVAACLVLAKSTNCDEKVIIRLSIVLFFALGALFIFILAKIIWGPYLALIASGLWSCYPIILWAARNPNTEIPFSVFFYAGIISVLRAWLKKKNNVRLFVIAGVWFGISMLIRPIAIGVGIVFAALILLGRSHPFRRRILFTLCLAAGNLAAIAPWEFYVYTQTSQLVLLCRGNQPFSLLDGLTFAVWNPDPAARRLGVPVPGDVRNLMNDLVRDCAPRISSQTISSREIAVIMAGELKKRPATVMKLMAIKAARSWYGTNTNRMESLIALVQTAYLAVLIWASIVFWRKRPDYRFLLIAGIVTVGYFWSMATLVLSIVRYMMPVLGACIIFFPVIPQFLLNRRYQIANSITATQVTTSP